MSILRSIVRQRLRNDNVPTRLLKTIMQKSSLEIDITQKKKKKKKKNV